MRVRIVVWTDICLLIVWIDVCMSQRCYFPAKMSRIYFFALKHISGVDYQVNIIGLRGCAREVKGASVIAPTQTAALAEDIDQPEIH